VTSIGRRIFGSTTSLKVVQGRKVWPSYRSSSWTL